MAQAVMMACHNTIKPQLNLTRAGQFMQHGTGFEAWGLLRGEIVWALASASAWAGKRAETAERCLLAHSMLRHLVGQVCLKPNALQARSRRQVAVASSE